MALLQKGLSHSVLPNEISDIYVHIFSLLYFQPHRLENCRCHRRSTITRSAKKMSTIKKVSEKRKKGHLQHLFLTMLIVLYFNNFACTNLVFSVFLTNIQFLKYFLMLSTSSMFQSFYSHVFLCLFLVRDTFHSQCNPDLIDICASEKIQGLLIKWGAVFYIVDLHIPWVIYFTNYFSDLCNTYCTG